MSDLLTTTEAATRLGVSVPRVRQLLIDGRIPATKHGRDWLVRAEDVDAYTPRPSGKPRLPDDVATPQALYRRKRRALT
jgi:excisionase family DNA binding protein